MGRPVFHFREFSVVQEHAAMRVNTDSVMLGAWVEAHGPGRILDIGTGTGMLALMMAQRFHQAVIDAVELDEGACLDATLNFQKSRWSDRLSLHQGDFRDWVKERGVEATYPLIITNPPYFPNSLRPELAEKRTARHQDKLPLDQLFELGLQLLAKDGTMAMILPAESRTFIEAWAPQKGAFVQRMLEVSARPQSPVLRILLQIGFPVVGQRLPKNSNERLSIHETHGDHYSPAYKKLTGSFYLPRDTNQKGQVDTCPF